MGTPDPACAAVRTWLSARHDREVPLDPAAAGHADACAGCAAFRAGLRRLDAALPAFGAGAAPDLTAPAVAAWRAGAEHAGAGWGARLLLALAGVGGLALTALALTAGAGHEQRDLLGFTVALAVVFLLAGRDPARYGRPLLPVTSVAVLSLLLVSARSTVVVPDPLVEAGHLTLLAGLAGLLLVARDRGHLTPAARRGR